MMVWLRRQSLGVLQSAVLGLFIFCCGLVTAAESKTPPDKSDVRLLIDISGSMKQNDPNNLRIPALRLVTNLMPKGSDAGVWAFGRYINMLVPLKPVDAEWQQNATEAAGKINSAGLFTNIGDAMAKSSWDWNSPASDESRSMILLTDGMVDISKDPKVNAKERQRILNDILPRLKNAGVTIHTIALSEQADKELLQTLANETDGWFRAVSNADELQKVFLKIFEQATPRDSLPIDNNQFKVDGSIDEMTLLVFREPGSPGAKLIAPTAETISKDTVSQKVRWFASSAYDLITVTQPAPGNWQIDAAIDPDNRVMVVSKLGLAVEELPNNVLANEQISYSVTLKEEGEPITKPDFLNLVDAKLETKYRGKENITPLLRDASKGSFQQVFFAGEEDGVLEIKLVVKSPTFERSRTHAINIYGNPVMADLEQSFAVDKPHFIHLRVTEDVVDIENLRVTGQITYPDETSQFISIENWQQPVKIEARQFPEGGLYQVDIKAVGQSRTGRPFTSDIPKISFEVEPLEGFAKPEPEPEVKEPEPEPEPEIKEPEPEVKEPEVKEPEPEPEKKDPEPEPEGAPVNWALWLSVGLVANILLIVLGWVIWRTIRKKTQSQSDEMAQELFSDDEENEEVE
ncbi:MAG: VWA domain-containing protein [Gammaproteobacteria bacterium]|nr:VWA domain-containing protein [Gammaproteobacteria bacterium]